MFTDLIYAYGRSSDGDLVALSDIHALGFESKLEYVANDASTFVFSFDLPLHIEDGSSRFIVSQFGQPVPLNIGPRFILNGSENLSLSLSIARP